MTPLPPAPHPVGGPAPHAALRRWATGLFLLLVGGLLVHASRRVPWADVGQALQALPAWRLAVALALAAAGHAVYASLDLLSRRVVQHDLPAGRVLAIAAASYGINQNLGYLVGGLGLRLRLYAGFGLPLETAAGVASATAASNWLGHGALLALLLGTGLAPLPAVGALPPAAWLAAAALALLLTLAYLAACARWPGRHWQWRRLSLQLPPLPVAGLQLLAGAASWGLMAAVVWSVLPAGVPYAAVAVAFLAAAAAGALAHVPAGLGVLEAVMTLLLARWLPAHQVIAALLVYRAAYQWLPGLLAGLGTLLLERRLRRPVKRASTGPGAGSGIR